jgi:hypothetical protein
MRNRHEKEQRTANMGLPQTGPDQLSSAAVLYQSFVMRLDRFIIGFRFN